MSSLIPPVEDPPEGRERYAGRRGNRPFPSTYMASRESRDGDLPKTFPSRYARDRYRDDGVGDSYLPDGQSERSELFAGYNPEKSRFNRFRDGPSLDDDPLPDEGDEEDVESIKKKITASKESTVNTTRSALEKARRAEEVAAETLKSLGDQSGNQLSNLSLSHNTQFIYNPQRDSQTPSNILTKLKSPR